jgi:hypothetical protein
LFWGKSTPTILIAINLLYFAYKILINPDVVCTLGSFC